MCGSGWSLYDSKSETRRSIYDIMNEIKHLFITPYISIVEIICEIKCIISENMSENSSYIYGTMSETKW